MRWPWQEKKEIKASVSLEHGNLTPFCDRFDIEGGWITFYWCGKVQLCMPERDVMRIAFGEWEK